MLPGDPTLARILSNLAWLHFLQRRYFEAERINRHALTEWENSVGSEHPRLIPYLTNHALILRKLERKTEAAQFQARAAAIKAKYGPDLVSQTIDVSILRSSRNNPKRFQGSP